LVLGIHRAFAGPETTPSTSAKNYILQLIDRDAASTGVSTSAGSLYNAQGLRAVLSDVNRKLKPMYQGPKGKIGSQEKSNLKRAKAFLLEHLNDIKDYAPAHGAYVVAGEASRAVDLGSDLFRKKTGDKALDIDVAEATIRALKPHELQAAQTGYIHALERDIMGDTKKLSVYLNDNFVNQEGRAYDIVRSLFGDESAERLSVISKKILTKYNNSDENAAVMATREGNDPSTPNMYVRMVKAVLLGRPFVAGGQGFPQAANVVRGEAAGLPSSTDTQLINLLSRKTNPALSTLLEEGSRNVGREIDARLLPIAAGRGQSAVWAGGRDPATLLNLYEE